MSFSQRTHLGGSLRADHAGQTVTLNGWAHKVRDLGGVTFVDVRDRSGLVQVVFDPTKLPDGADVRNECCIAVTGQVRMRDEAVRNPKMATGDIEIAATSIEILGPAKALPFPVSDEEQMKSVNEELRVKYRYLDIRRPSMHRMLALRAAATGKLRRYLEDQGFLEIETPIFTKSTPEGARDYLVPYRLEPGKFYALPQSPQQYKQILMVAGMERYFQIARCFRDEAQRADRQPEFTQLDLEMSFVTQEDILTLIEGMTRTVTNELIDQFELPLNHVEPFWRMPYDESMERYGCDKPDRRFDLELFDVSEEVRNSGFGVFSGAVEGGGRVRGVRYPGGIVLSRKEVTGLEDYCKEFGAKGMAFLYVARNTDDGEGVITTPSGKFVRGGCSKMLSGGELDAILAKSSAEPGDLLCFIADHYASANNILYRLRNEIGQRCGLRDPRKLSFGYVIDFPLVEWNPDARRWDSVHHPFTAPKADDMQYLDSDPGRVRADCYDIVCNGGEWASGSIRINRPDIQAKIFDLLGIDEATQQARFGHILEAFQYGAPPHGGIAPGIDRYIMLLLGIENIRDVMAFPKMGNGYDPFMDAPSTIDPMQWAELGLRVT
ncbi:MAG: aspartate--tRNA ligase [Chthonomonas sp.]|nr:aspartate--tRNA ligase [Chthonomonas sp.]